MLSFADFKDIYFAHYPFFRWASMAFAHSRKMSQLNQADIASNENLARCWPMTRQAEENDQPAWSCARSRSNVRVPANPPPTPK